MLGETPSLLSFVIYFIYGLAFFVMGIALILETSRSPSLAETRLLLPLAIFGILHGMHEWFEFFLQQALWLDQQVSARIFWVRMGLLAISFIALMIYGARACRLNRADCRARRRVQLSFIGTYLLIIIFSWLTSGSSIPLTVTINNLIRYLLAVPAALLAAFGLRTQMQSAQAENRILLAKNFNWAALGFGIYALSQLFASKTPIFPASIINNQTFYHFTGVPIEAFRSVTAILITVGIVRGTQNVEQERQIELLKTQEERVKALENVQEEMVAREHLRRELLRHTVQAQEDERSRISRELHDETAQVLSAFSLELAALGNRLDEKSRDLLPTIERLQTLSKRMSQGIYRLVHDLRPAQLDDLGLVPAIQNLIGHECCKMDLEVSLDVAGASQRVDPLTETVLYRVAQAALTNVSRHSHSQQAQVQIRFEKDWVTMQITDEGIGFDPHEPLIAPRGWGLEGMKERVTSVGGKFSIQSAPAKGTKVIATIPCIPDKKEDLR